MLMWSRVFSFDQRETNSIQASNKKTPPMYGLRKDHKAVAPISEKWGQPQRPLFGAVLSYNDLISDLISIIIHPIV